MWGDRENSTYKATNIWDHLLNSFSQVEPKSYWHPDLPLPSSRTVRQWMIVVQATWATTLESSQQMKVKETIAHDILGAG